MRFFKSGIWFGPLASGLLLGVSVLPIRFIPFGHWAIFFGFVPLWNAWLQDEKNIFFRGWITQFFLTLLAFNWLAHTMREFSFMPWPVAILVLVLFSAVANLHIPLAGVLARRIFSRKIYSEPSRIAAIFLLTALGERYFPMIFRWNLGYVWFFEGWPGFHFADVVGFQGLSTFSLAVNALILFAWRQFRSRMLRWWWPLLAAGGVIFLINGAGLYRETRLVSPSGKISALLVQANIGNKQKHEAEHGAKSQEAILDKYLHLTEKGLTSARPDFVLWPENAFPDFILDANLSYGASSRLKGLVQKNAVDLITGGFGLNDREKITNSIFAIGREGNWLAAPYQKTILMPFGEYVPGAEFFPGIKKLLPHVRDFGAGAGPQVAQIRGKSLGFQICYEGLFDWFSRDLARQGADIFINVTNDSWYGAWQEPYQHFYMTMGRAVETRRPLIRATNTGISGVALASGEILAASPIDQEWIREYEVPYVAGAPLSPFSAHGYWVLPVILCLALVLLWAKKIPERRKAVRDRNDFYRT